MRGEGESCFKTDEIMRSQGLGYLKSHLLDELSSCQWQNHAGRTHSDNCLYTPPWQGNSGAATHAIRSSIAETVC